MRLIDADKLIEHLEKVKEECSSLVDISHIVGFQAAIDIQPTVYDTDKVVEQLQKISDEAHDLIMVSDSPQYYDGYEDGVDKAIGIVKGGGVDGN